MHQNWMSPIMKNVECVILERYSLGRVKKSDPDDDGDGSENTGDVEI